MTRTCALAVLALVACGQDRQDRSAPPAIAPRVRMLTDQQFANAVRDLLVIEAPAIHTPGSTPHQLVHEDVIAIDGARLVEYRMAAEQIAATIAVAPRCSELPCAVELAERAFRRPLDPDERDRIGALFEQGGYPLVVETVLQAPSFLYRTELGNDGRDLTPFELAAELSFLFYDSLPDPELRGHAADGSLADPDVLDHEVDRLLADPRVQDHVLQVVLDWLQVHRVLEVDKAYYFFPELTPELRASMYGETERFVRDVLFVRHGSLRELLTSRSTFLDERLAAHYDITSITGDSFQPYTHDGSQRAGILTQASLLTALASASRESIIQRGKFVQDTLLCAPELGRPPFDKIASVAAFTSKLSESQFAHYRIANGYCAACHRTIDPPGRAMERFDGIGRWRFRDEIGIAVEDDTTIEVDGQQHDIRGAIQLGEVLANSNQIAHCAVEQLTQHAFGRRLDPHTLDRFVVEFEDSDRNLVELFRAIATSPTFRTRKPEAQ